MIRKIVLLAIVFITITSNAQNEKLSEKRIVNIQKVIRLFQQKDIDKIATIMSFPLERQYPIPSIKNKKEFKQRFNEVFDDTLISKIANSTIDQWSEMGWRGIMLANGVIWIELYTGKIITVNYQSDFEKKLKNELIAKEKEIVHASLKIFKEPTYKIKTKHYLIRIDELSDGSYRYASWKMGRKESSKPDIVLYNGILTFDGSGGNHHMTFINGNYTYIVFRNIIETADFPDITLNVKKNNKTIVTEDGMLVIK